MYLKKSLLLILLLSLFCTVPLSFAKEYFVSLQQNDLNSVSKDPSSISFDQIQKKIQQAHTAEEEEICFTFDTGRYTLQKPFILTSDQIKIPVIFQSPEGAEVIFQGGTILQGWQRVSANLWKIKIEEVANKQVMIRQLFAGETRLTRARTPNYPSEFLTNGPLVKYKEKIKKGDYGNSGRLRSSDIGAFCGFSFKSKNIELWPDWEQAEIIIHHGWESSWHTIEKIDIPGEQVYLKSPSRYPIGHFNNEMRYRIENIKSGLDSPNEWYLNYKTGELFLFLDPTGNPDEMNIIAPHISKMIVLQGSESEKIKNVTFKGIKFKYCDYELSYFDLPEYKQFQGVIGYTDTQASPGCGGAIELEDASNISFVDCEFSHLGNIAVRACDGCSNLSVEGCHAFDTGGGGIYIGRDIRKPLIDGYPQERASHSNIIKNCLLHDVGIIHPSSVGIWIAQSNNNVIEHNTLFNLPYSGISVGWTWSDDENYSNDNRVSYNDIYKTNQFHGDGGPIYTLGTIRDGRIQYNYIHDVQFIHGARGAGIYTDEHSRGLLIEGNIIKNVDLFYTRFNVQEPGYHCIFNNFFDPGMPLKTIKGVIGNGAYADGTMSRSVPHNAAMECKEFTVEAWIKTDKSMGRTRVDKYILAKNGDPGTNGHFGLIYNGSEAGCIMNIGSGQNNVHKLWSDFPIADEKWHHLVMTYDSNDLKFYVDADLAGVKTIHKKRNPNCRPRFTINRKNHRQPWTFENVITNADANLEIARLAGRADDTYFVGAIDEIRLYEGAIPQKIIQKIYDDPKKQYNVFASESKAQPRYPVTLYVDFDMKDYTGEEIIKDVIKNAGIEQTYKEMWEEYLKK